MSYLQLADGPVGTQSMYLQDGGVLDYYIEVPAELSKTGKVQYIREDIFDNVPDNLFEQYLDTVEMLEEGNCQYMSEDMFLAGKEERQARRQARRDRRAERRAGRDARKEDRRSNRARRRDARTRRLEARTDIQEQVARGEREQGGVFAGIMDTVGGIFGGGAEDRTGQLTTDINYANGEFDYDIGYQSDSAQWITGVPNWVVITGGVALVGTGIYLATRKK